MLFSPKKDEGPQDASFYGAEKDIPSQSEEKRPSLWATLAQITPH